MSWILKGKGRMYDEVGVEGTKGGNGEQAQNWAKE